MGAKTSIYHKKVHWYFATSDFHNFLIENKIPSTVISHISKMDRNQVSNCAQIFAQDTKAKIECSIRTQRFLIKFVLFVFIFTLSQGLSVETSETKLILDLRPPLILLSYKSVASEQCNFSQRNHIITIKKKSNNFTYSIWSRDHNCVSNWPQIGVQGTILLEQLSCCFSQRILGGMTETK